MTRKEAIVYRDNKWRHVRPPDRGATHVRVNQATYDPKENVMKNLSMIVENSTSIEDFVT